jgi:cell wall-associated NlpC family hydrolase
LTAAAASLDPRTTLARPDLAEQALEGVVRAKAFRAARPMHCAGPVVDIRAAADGGADRLDQIIFGEAFDVLDRAGDFVWGKARRDGVVGWVALAELAESAPAPAARVAATAGALPLNALVTDASGVETDDLAPIGSFEDDLVAVAERLLGTPHALGARSSVATDCSGLVQQCLYACGRAGPRYADQQAELGEAAARGDLKRGDLVVWPHPKGGDGWTGHSALAVDGGTIIHASGHHGAVVREALVEAEARYAADGFEAPVFRRL